jgi:hypothetical protein
VVYDFLDDLGALVRRRREVERPAPAAQALPSAPR